MPNPSFGTAGAASYDGYTNNLSLQPGGQVILTSSSYGIQKVFLSRIGPIFADVPYIHPYHDDVEILYANGLTAGCSTTPLKFCPDQIMDRGQAAVFMVRGALGAGYVPNPTANLFQDDWTPGTWARPWAESMRETNLTTGCQLSPLLYCPWQQLQRAGGDLWVEDEVWEYLPAAGGDGYGLRRHDGSELLRHGLGGESLFRRVDHQLWDAERQAKVLPKHAGHPRPRRLCHCEGKEFDDAVTKINYRLE